MFLYRFKYSLFGFFLSEHMEVSLDLTLVLYRDFLDSIFQDIHCPEIQFFLSHLHNRANRVRHDVDGVRVIVLVTNNVDCQRQSDFPQFFSE